MGAGHCHLDVWLGTRDRVAMPQVSAAVMLGMKAKRATCSPMNGMLCPKARRAVLDASSLPQSHMRLLHTSFVLAVQLCPDDFCAVAQ